MCSWHKQLPHVIGIGPQWATANVRQKAAVVCEVRGSQSDKRLTQVVRIILPSNLPRKLTSVHSSWLRVCQLEGTDLHKDPKSVAFVCK